MAREERRFEMIPDAWEHFDNITNALGHDSPEETLKILIELGFKAVGVSDRSQRTVQIMGGEKAKRKNFCTDCRAERMDEYYPKQMAVQLGVDEATANRQKESAEAKTQGGEKPPEGE